MKKRVLAILLSGAMAFSSFTMPGTAMTVLAAEESSAEAEGNENAEAEVSPEENADVTAAPEEAPAADENSNGTAEKPSEEAKTGETAADAETGDASGEEPQGESDPAGEEGADEGATEAAEEGLTEDAAADATLTEIAGEDLTLDTEAAGETTGVTLVLVNDAVSISTGKEDKSGVIGLLAEGDETGETLRKDENLTIGLYSKAAATDADVAAGFTITNAEDVNAEQHDETGASYFRITAKNTSVKGGTYYLKAQTDAMEAAQVFKLKITIDKTAPKLTTQFRKVTKTESNAFLTDYYQELYFGVDGGAVTGAALTPVDTASDNLYVCEYKASASGASDGEFVITYAGSADDEENTDQSIWEEKVFPQELAKAENGEDATGKDIFTAAKRSYTLSVNVEGYESPITKAVTLPASYTVGTVRAQETTVTLAKGQESFTVTPIIKYPQDTNEYFPTMGDDGAVYVIYRNATKKTAGKLLTEGTFDSASIEVPADAITENCKLTLYVMEPGWNGFAKTNITVNVKENTTYTFTDTVYNIATGTLETAGTLRCSDGTAYTAGKLQEGEIASTKKGLIVNTTADGRIYLSGVEGLKAGKNAFKDVELKNTAGEVIGTASFNVNVVNVKASYAARDKQVSLSTDCRTAENVLSQPIKTRRAYSIDLAATQASISVKPACDSLTVKVDQSASTAQRIVVKNTVTSKTPAGKYTVTVTPVASNGTSQTAVKYTVVVTGVAAVSKITQTVTGKLDFTKRSSVAALKVTLKTADTSLYVTEMKIDDAYGLDTYCYYGYDNAAPNTFNAMIWFDPDATSTTLGVGQNQTIPVTLTLSNGTVIENYNIKVTTVNSKLTIKDSLAQHNVLLSMKNATAYGVLKLSNTGAKITGITTATTNKTPFEVKYLGNASYKVYVTDKSQLKKKTYSVPLAVHTSYDADGCTTTVNVKIVVK